MSGQNKDNHQRKGGRSYFVFVFNEEGWPRRHAQPAFLSSYRSLYTGSHDTTSSEENMSDRARIWDPEEGKCVRVVTMAVTRYDQLIQASFQQLVLAFKPLERSLNVLIGYRHVLLE